MTLPKLNGDNKFWQFNVGHLLTLASMVVAAIVVFINYDRRVGHLEYEYDDHEKRIKVSEQAFIELRPKLESTATNLQFLTDYIRDQAAKKHSP